MAEVAAEVEKVYLVLVAVAVERMVGVVVGVDLHVVGLEEDGGEGVEEMVEAEVEVEDRPQAEDKVQTHCSRHKVHLDSLKELINEKCSKFDILLKASAFA